MAKKNNLSLPSVILIPKKVSEKMKDYDDALTDYLSDTYGYCVSSVDDKKIRKRHYAFKIKWDVSQ